MDKNASKKGLRFPEFSGQKLRKIHLKKVTTECSARNTQNLSSDKVMGVSKFDGMVPTEAKVAEASLSRYKVVQKDWFAYNPMRVNIGSIARWNGEDDVIVSPDYVVFRCLQKEPDAIDPDFLDQFRKSDQWERFVTGTGMGGVRVRIYYENLARIRLLLPSIREQQKIADCLGSLDDLIAAHTAKLDALQDHKKGLHQQLFPAEGETTPKLRCPEFLNTGKWNSRNIAEFAKVTTGSKDTQNKIENGRYPFFVRSQTVERIDSYSFDGEAVLTSGDGVGVGKNYHYINGKFDFHQRVYCIYDFKKDVNACFFYLYFSEHFRNRVLGMSAKNSVDSVRMAMITEMPISLPSLPEQKKIANCLRELDTLISVQTEQIETLKEHKKGLMQQLFPNPDLHKA